MIAAIEQYANAVHGQVVVHNDESDRQLRDAQHSLQRESHAFLTQGALALTRERLQAVRERLDAYQAQGQAVARAADMRQSMVEEFSARLGAMETLTQSEMDRAWKIFGRVVARQSLLDLKSDLDEIRARFARLPATDDYDRKTLAGVEAGITTLTTSFQKAARSLVQSQGHTWVDQMRDDIAQLSALQEALIQADARRTASLEGLADLSVNLVSWMRAVKPAPPPGARAPTRSYRPSSPAAVSVPVPVPAFAPASSTPPTLAAAPEVTLPPSMAGLGEQTIESTSERPGEHAALIEWISGSVLLLMFLVSLWTVISIVGPVRRMRSATRRIAAGEADVQVARGGIQELDELAVSFNQMAKQLASAQAEARLYQDQLEAKVAQRTRELQHLAEHDPLTQLPNRRQLFTHLKDAIAKAKANGTLLGVFFLDLDNFKNINDSMGHAFGDRILAAIAEQLRTVASKNGFAARLGGDEFTVVCGGAVTEDDVQNLGRELVRAFQKPISVDGQELMVGMSVGASQYPQHGTDAESLLRAADAALFQAKAQGRSQLMLFRPELLEAASVKFSTEQGLRRAMERSEFELVFQPEISAATFETSLVEALLRWRLPDGRLACPIDFLDVAEQSGLIVQISDWVLQAAISAAAGWHHGDWPEARVAINLSSRQLLDGRLAERVMELLREHRLPPQCIEIELTESVLQTGAGTIETLRRLRAGGVAIALDDFGSGYSSLASLEQLPLSRVKLDRSLIASIHSSPRSAAIARAIIGLCHSLGLAVTAEGIESPEQLVMLSDDEAICLQGYLLARPAAADKLLTEMAGLPAHVQSLLLEVTAAPASEPQPVLLRKAARSRVRAAGEPRG